MVLKVLKFGGTSVTNGSREIIDIIAENKDNKLIIILSAFSDITNILHRYDKLSIKILIKRLKYIHNNFIEKYIKHPVQLHRQLNVLYDNLRYLLYYHKKSRQLDCIVNSYGEKCSVIIYNYFLKENGYQNLVIWSEYLICTEDNYSDSFPYMISTKMCIRAFLKPRLKKHDIVLTTGFIGSNKNGCTTNLSRNGSDLSATVIGSCLKPEQIIIYKDVDGIMTCDPRKVPFAKLINTVNYKTISELCYFGSHVLHSQCLIPFKLRSIPLLIKNIFNKNSLGTLILEDHKSKSTVDALTSITDHAMLTIKGMGMNGFSGLLLNILKVIAEYNINIPFITQASSEQNICLCIQAKYANIVQIRLIETFENEIDTSQIDSIDIDDNIAIITVIGENMIHRYGIAGIIFETLGKEHINIIAISQGSCERSISFIIDKKDEIKALLLLHAIIL